MNEHPLQEQLAKNLSAAFFTMVTIIMFIAGASWTWDFLSAESANLSTFQRIAIIISTDGFLIGWIAIFLFWSESMGQKAVAAMGAITSMIASSLLTAGGLLRGQGMLLFGQPLEAFIYLVIVGHTILFSVELVAFNLVSPASIRQLLRSAERIRDWEAAFSDERIQREQLRPMVAARRAAQAVEREYQNDLEPELLARIGTASAKHGVDPLGVPLPAPTARASMDTDDAPTTSTAPASTEYQQVETRSIAAMDAATVAALARMLADYKSTNGVAPPKNG